MRTSLKRSWAISSLGIASGIFVAMMMATPLTAAAQATAKPAAPAPAPAVKAGPTAPEIGPTQWVKVCDPKNAKICQITEDYAVVGSTTPIGSISIQTMPDPGKFGVGIQVPLGFLLDAGIPLSIDGDKKANAQFITCLPSPQSQAYFCVAQVLADQAFVDQLKKAKLLQLQLTYPDKTSTTLAFPLATFAQAFDGPDQAALARQREDAAKVLAEKAKERAKQLEGQQGQQPKP
jgi:invasion protein IalB